MGASGSTTTAMNGATDSIYTTPPLMITTSCWVRVTGGASSTDSDTATITVATPPAAGTAPAITSHPDDQLVTSGQTVTLSVDASGTSPLSYQWYAGTSGTTSEPFAGATSQRWETPPVTTAANFWVRVSNTFGLADSSTATMTVTESPPSGTAPTITAQPEDLDVTSGQTATLTVEADSTEPLSHQWFVGASGSTSAAIPGATSDAYTTPPLSTTTSYWVRVSNAHGADDSVTATMTVIEAAPPPPPEPPPPVDTSDAFEGEVIALVNQHRAAGASCGGNPYPAVDPLSLDTNLRAAARAHSADMGTNGYFSHTSQDGTTFSQRIWNLGYSGGFPVGENIAADSQCRRRSSAAGC